MVAAELSQMWQALSDSEKAKFEEQAKGILWNECNSLLELKAEYEKTMAAYKSSGGAKPAPKKAAKKEESEEDEPEDDDASENDEE